jgi:hypothetical protein
MLVERCCRQDFLGENPGIAADGKEVAQRGVV